jgi:segregation and condensation protein B
LPGPAWIDFKEENSLAFLPVGFIIPDGIAEYSTRATCAKSIRPVVFDFQNSTSSPLNQDSSKSNFSDEREDDSLVSYLESMDSVDGEAIEWDHDPVSQLKRVESVLFLARKPLSLKKISEQAFLEDATQARTIVGQLNARYERSGQSFHVNSVAGGCQLMTRPQFSDWISRLGNVTQRQRLSGPAMETLTVVAYRQPIIKAEIEAIRGVACGEMLRQLLELNLVKITGRSEKLGRPFLYATTKEFLIWFGLNSLQDLPKAKELLGTGLPEWATLDNNS